MRMSSETVPRSGMARYTAEHGDLERRLVGRIIPPKWRDDEVTDDSVLFKISCGSEPHLANFHVTSLFAETADLKT